MAHTIKAEDLEAAIMHAERANSLIWETLETEDPKSSFCLEESDAGDLIEGAIEDLKSWKDKQPKTEAEALEIQKNILYKFFLAHDKLNRLFADYDGEKEQPDQVAQELEQAENTLL